MSNEQIFIACMLSFLGGCVLVHFAGPARWHVRRLRHAFRSQAQTHIISVGFLNTEKRELSDNLDKLLVVTREARDTIEKMQRSVNLLKEENDLLQEVITGYRGNATDMHFVLGNLRNAIENGDFQMHDLSKKAHILSYQAMKIGVV